MGSRVSCGIDNAKKRFAFQFQFVSVSLISFSYVFTIKFTITFIETEEALVTFSLISRSVAKRKQKNHML